MARLIKLTAAAVGAATAVVAAVVWRRRVTSDVADRVRQELAAQFGDSAQAIAIRAERGLVTLRGEVDEMGDIARFEAVVRAVAGVRDVDNLLRLRLFGVAARPSVRPVTA